MALTRKLLKGMGLSEEQIDSIIDAHTDTVDGLKEDINRYKSNAEKLPAVQKELDDLKAAGDGGYKEKYENEKKAFEDFKKAQSEKETRQAKVTAYTAFLKSVGVSEKRIPSIIKVTDLNSVELEGDKVKNAETLTESVKTEWADFIETSNTNGANTQNPPANNSNNGDDPSKMTMDEYIAYRNKK